MLSIRSRRSLLYVVAGIILAAAAAVWFMVAHPSQTPPHSPAVSQVKTLTSPFGLTVDADPSLAISGQASRVDTSGTLWQIDSPTGTPTFRITADYEQGDSIKKLVSASKKSPRDAMADNLNRQLPQSYPGYHLLNKRQLSQHGSDGLMIDFTYTSNSQTVRQRLLLLVKNDSAAAYIRVQALDSDFSSIESRYVTPLLDSARFN